MTSSASKSKAPSVLKQSLITSGFILLLGIFHSLTEKSSSPAHTDGDKPQSVDDNLETKKQDSNSERFQKFWRKPVRWKVVSYYIALALLPVVIAAIGAAMVGTATEDSGKYLLFFILAYVSYFVFAFWVIVSRATIGKLVYGENDVPVWSIYLWIIVPALVSGVSTAVLKDSPILSFFISLALLALITYKSQRHLSLPLSFLQEAEENSNKEKAEQG